VILVPVEALREITSGNFAVFVIENDEPVLRVIEVGIIDITYAEVISGLDVGEIVSTGIIEVE
jgi:multidrug efflux pump subunit AcrA (membrane-fusion protein)